MKKQKILMPNVFQIKALKELRATKQKKGVIVMPTGIGKTFLAALWTKEQLVKYPQAKVLFICHNRDILSQANELEFQTCLKHLNLNYGYYDCKTKNIQQITFGTTQTLARNLDKINKNQFDYIIVDEAHHYQAITFKKVVKHFKSKFLLGLTATPYREDNKSIFEVCGKIIYNVSIKEGIDNDLLTKINYYCVDNDIDFSKIKIKNNVYDRTDLNKKLCVKKYDDAILSEYKKNVLGKRKKTICFCATVEHAHRMNNVFINDGIKSTVLTGKYVNKKHRITVHKHARTKTINDFKNNKYDIIFVVDLFNEGINIPDADCVMMLRPTYSNTIFTQQLGRGLRKAKGKTNVLILDYTGNAKRCDIAIEVLSEIMGINIIKHLNEQSHDVNVSEIIIFNGGCSIRLSKQKIDILNNKYNYSNKELIDDFLKLKTKLSRVPNGSDMKKNGYAPSYIYIHRFGGSWKSFLKMVNCYTPPPTKQKLIDGYNELKQKLGKIPSVKDLDKSIYNELQYRKYWGTWYNFVTKIMNDTPAEGCGDRNKYTKKELIDYYFELKKQLKRQPIGKDMTILENGAKYSLNKYVSKFGSWTKFLKEIGEPLNQNNVGTKDITKQELIDNYNDVKQKLGRRPTCDDIIVNKGSKYGMLKYLGHFGTWINFLDSIGEPSRKLNISKKNIKIEFERVCNKLGKIPTRGEFDKQSKYNSFTLIKRFGTKWDDVLKANKVKIKKQISNNINVISNYKPITKVKPLNKKNMDVKVGGAVKGWKPATFKSSDYKNNIRCDIIKRISDGDNVLLLESPELSALKEIEKLGIMPKKITIPNHLEFKQLIKALESYKTKLNIEVINTSVLQYIVDTKEVFDYIWLDYCGAFSYYVKDLDMLFKKDTGNTKLILTYNLFDMVKSDDDYYFTKVIDYVLSKNNNRTVRLINDVSKRYKSNMYNIGFNIEDRQKIEVK